MSDSHSLARATSFLIARQGELGQFEDYALPVGASNQWLTGYAGNALFVAAEAQMPGARDAAERAAAYLRWFQTYPEGFGYNELTGPDTDSTAQAVLLLARTGHPIEAAVLRFLAEAFRPGRGFATYPGRSDAWGDGHLCVTPVVAGALLAAGSPVDLAALTALFAAREDEQGGWPAYWWRGNAYANYVVTRFLAQETPEFLRAQTVRVAADQAFDSCFELACLAGRFANLPWPKVADAMTEALCRHQLPSGAFPGGSDLRVTDPAIFAPRPGQDGRCYADPHGILTTATAVMALAEHRLRRAQTRSAAVENAARGA